MKRQILLSLVSLGRGPSLLSNLSNDQSMGLLNEDFAETFQRDNKLPYIKLTEKGRKIYNALEAVIAIGTQW